MKTKREIEDQIAETFDQMENGTRWPGMSYEEGVRNALDWVIGNTDTKPMDDE
jgi:hypothetical protein